MMPLARYFLFAGGALLALLFAFDAFSPKAVADNSSHASAGVDKATLRIHSDVKWPERIVFDTTQPTIVPKAAPAQPLVLVHQPDRRGRTGGWIDPEKSGWPTGGRHAEGLAGSYLGSYGFGWPTG